MELEHLKECVRRVEKYNEHDDVCTVTIKFCDDYVMNIGWTCIVLYDDENVYFKTRFYFKRSHVIFKFNLKNIKSIESW